MPAEITLPADFALEASLTFLPPAGTDTPRRFRMQAYDGGLLRLGNAPYPVIVDLSGMRTVDQVKALMSHDAAQPVGHMEQVQIGDTIEAEGVFSVPRFAADIDAAQQNGFRWEASIGATIEDGARDVIAAGQTVHVNGRTFRGPVIVARKTLLREVSFTGVGAGSNTSARIVASATPTTYEGFAMPGELPPPETKPAVDPAVTQELTELRELKASFKAEQEALKTAREELQAEREAARRERVVDSIDRIMAQYGNPGEDIVAALKDKAKSGAINETEIELTILRAAGNQKLGGFRPIGGKSGAPANSHVIEAALCLTQGWEESELEKFGMDQKTINAALETRWSGFGPRALFVESLQARGHHVTGGQLQDNDIQAAVSYSEQDLIQASGASSTISVPGILSNVARKEMLRRLDAFTPCITKLAKRGTTSDYKPFYMYRMSTGAMLEQVGADGELKSMELQEAEFQARVYPFGKKLSLNAVMIRNDDMSAFTDLAGLFGLTAVRTLEFYGFKTLLAKQDTFWTTGKGNRLAAGAGSALGLDSLGSAYQLFLAMKDFTGQYIGMEPKYLTVSPTNKVLAGKLYKDSQVNLAAAGDTDVIVERLSGNSYQGMFQPLYSPYLSQGAVPNANGSQWLLSADPNVIAPIVVVYLDGKTKPQIKTWEAIPGKMGMQWDATFNFGFNLLEDTGSVYSPGQ